MTDVLWDGPEGGPVLVLAHGAGSPMDSAWMDEVAALLAARGVRVARFEFAYMASRRNGGRKPPARAPTLMDEYRQLVAELRAQRDGPVLIGGKSLGGRIATMVADELHIAGSVGGVVCLGYPFHPTGQPLTVRTEHLAELATPTLICQGTRDPFGTLAEVSAYPMSPAIRVAWIEDGEHGFVPRPKLSGRSHADNLIVVADAVAGFVGDRARGSA